MSSVVGDSMEWYHETLQTYLKLDKKINHVIADKADLIAAYHARPLIHSNYNWDGNGDKIRYPSSESLVIEYVDTSAVFDDLLASLYYRKKKFDDYLSELLPVEKYQLGHDPDLDLKTYQFIKQTEKQVKAAYRF